jgi:2-oxoglutarate ferredoxin oxidoreductase subunit alpha
MGIANNASSGTADTCVAVGATSPVACERVVLQGNEAVAEAAIAAGARFFAGYPITPSTEIAERLSRRLPQVGGDFMQMEDEIASMAAVIGASLAGKKALTATSGPGFSLMQENIGYAAMAQVPCVVVNVMRGGPSTGLPTDPAQGDVMQARWGTHGEHSIITLVPSSVKECFTLTVRAFELSERYRTPVILLSDAVIGHMREAIDLPSADDLEIPSRRDPEYTPEEYADLVSTVDNILPRPALGSRFRVHVTGLVYDRRSGSPSTSAPPVAAELGSYLREKIYLHRDAITDVEELFMDDAELAVFAYGSVARSAKSAVRWAREQGLPVGLVRPVTIRPFPTAAVERMAERVRTIVVPEMNLRQIAWEVQAAVRTESKVVDYGRIDGKLIHPREIRQLIERELACHRARQATT